jgi:hypothetical protein
MHSSCRSRGSIDRPLAQVEDSDMIDFDAVDQTLDLLESQIFF